MIRIAVIDGQGAGIGSTIIKAIRQVYADLTVKSQGSRNKCCGDFPNDEKQAQNRGATGESAVCHCVHQVDIITGPISILISNALMGEVTPRMAQATELQRLIKLLLPLTLEPVVIVGVLPAPLPHLVDKLVNEHLSAISGG